MLRRFTMPSSRRLAPLFALIAGLSLAATACGSKETPGGRAAEEFPAPGEHATVKLLEAGSGDKVALRWQPKQGGVAKLRMNLDMVTIMEAAGQKMPEMAMPMTMVMAMTYKSVQADEMSVEFRYESMKMSMPGLPANAAESISEEFKKISGTMTLDTRGVIKTFDMKLPTTGLLASGGMDQMMEQMRDQMGKMSAPFPEEPVGVGAKWDVLSTVNLMGMKMRSVTTFELKSFADGKGKLATTMEQVAEKGALKLPGNMPVQAQLNKANTKGQGTMTFDLNRPLIMTGEMKATMEMDAEIKAQGQEADMKMSVKMDMVFKPEPTAPKPAGTATPTVNP